MSTNLKDIVRQIRQWWHNFRNPKDTENTTGGDKPTDSGSGASLKAFADPNKPFMGYGLVNNWAEQDAEKFLNKLVENNIQCMAMEFFEWSSPANFANLDKLMDKFEKYLVLAEKKKIIIYAMFLNCNLGSKKYGDPGITADKYDAQIKKAANQFAVWMKKYKNLYVTPCSEGGGHANTASYDRNLQNYCKSIWPRSQMVNNWGSRPTSTDGMSFFCQHPANTKVVLPVKAWCVSDHGLIIRELNVGGELYGNCNYSVTVAYAKKMRATKHPFIYYDFYKDSPIDDVALKALKDAQV